MGKSTILDYEILFDNKNLVSVKVYPYTSPIELEYCKLCFLYFTKIVYNFGGKTAIPSMALLDILKKLSKKKIGPKTNCFRITNYDDVVNYTDKLGSAITKFSGTVYSWGNNNRSIETKFPLSGTEQQTVFGFLALLQFTINKVKNIKLLLIYLNMCILGLPLLYRDFEGSSLDDVVGIPNSLFSGMEKLINSI